MIWLKRISLYIVSAIIIYVLYVMILVFSPDISDYFNRTDFNSQVWKTWVESEATFKTRWNMIHDLTKNHELVGKTKPEIKNLLGKPSNEWSDGIRYYLGLTGRGINTGSLYFKIENGKVISFKIWQG